MSTYQAVVLPYQARRINDEWLVVSPTGDHLFLNDEQAGQLADGSIKTFSLELQARLKSRFFVLGQDAHGSRRLLASRLAARNETVNAGPSLHIIVPTLQCAHSCQYCQVSRSIADTGHTLSVDMLLKACDSIFESPARNLTVEFQGGDPLIRFDLVKLAILHISERNSQERRNIRFVVASTLHQLDEEMCRFFASHGVVLSTSVDGPASLHNRNRPIPGRDAYEKTINGISLARSIIGPDSVSALMTTTKASLSHPEAVVDEYVNLGFKEIFLRPLSSYGFAKRNQCLLGYTPEQFQSFYQRAFKRVLEWNRAGTPLREVYASIILNKILSSFDAGYVDLQSPTGAGRSVMVYNYDGYVYPCDEARMLAETGDTSLRLGKIGDSLLSLQTSPVMQELLETSSVERIEGCKTCTFKSYCAPNPVDAKAQHGRMNAPVLETEHCTRHQSLFDFFFGLIRNSDDALSDLLHNWARPAGAMEEPCAV